MPTKHSIAGIEICHTCYFLSEQVLHNASVLSHCLLLLNYFSA